MTPILTPTTRSKWQVTGKLCSSSGRHFVAMAWHVPCRGGWKIPARPGAETGGLKPYCSPDSTAQPDHHERRVTTRVRLDKTVKVFPATMTRQVTLGAACWALSIAYFADQALAQTASTRPYSMATNLISDLGITACGPYSGIGHADVCSPLHGLVNGTFIVVGLLHAIGALATRQAWPRGPQRSFGLGFIALAGTGLILAGLAPENVAPTIHAVGALYGILALNVGMILLGLTLLSLMRGLGAMALVAGLVGLVGTILFLTSPALAQGATERVADYPAAAMLVVFGAYLLLSTVMGPTPVRSTTP